MSFPSLLALCGAVECGKSTLANALVKHHDYVRVSMAGRLKQAVAAAFGCTRAQLDDKTFKESPVRWRVNAAVVATVGGFFELSRGDLYDWLADAENALPSACYSTPRAALRHIGTDILRGHDDQIHIRFAAKEIDAHLADNRRVVSDDVRFENELEMFAPRGGESVWITRLGHSPAPSTHASDTSLGPQDCDRAFQIRSDKPTTEREFERFLRADHTLTVANLRDVQARCTELLEENRNLRRAFLGAR